MKTIANTIRFPKVGDRLRLVNSRELHRIREVVEIAPCDHRNVCKQDDCCKYCLTLKAPFGGGLGTSNHCWSNLHGEPWWEIVE